MLDTKVHCIYFRYRVSHIHSITKNNYNSIEMIHDTYALTNDILMGTRSEYVDEYIEIMNNLNLKKPILLDFNVKNNLKLGAI